MKKEHVAHLPMELQSAQPGQSFTKSQYEEKHGGMLPLSVLLPLIGLGTAAPVTTQAAANITQGSGISNANHQAQADVSGTVSLEKDNDAEKIKEAVAYL